MGLAVVGAGRLADIIDPCAQIFLGLLLYAAAMYYFALTSLEGSTPWFTFLVVFYMSFGCVDTPLTSIVLKTLPHDRLSIGSELDGIHWGLVGAFGIVLGSATLKYQTMVHMIGLGEGHEVWTPSV